MCLNTKTKFNCVSPFTGELSGHASGHIATNFGYSVARANCIDIMYSPHTGGLRVSRLRKRLDNWVDESFIEREIHYVQMYNEKE